MPRDVPGYYNIEARRSEFASLLKRLKDRSNVIVNANYVESLKSIGVCNEEFGKHQLEYIRKRNEKGIIYFVANQSNEFQEGWIRLGMPSASEIILLQQSSTAASVSRRGSSD